MASDIVVAPVFGSWGEAAHDLGSQVVLAGGVDYEGDPEDAHCKFFDADGVQCRGWATRGTWDGWCAGHRKAAVKRAQ